MGIGALEKNVLLILDIISITLVNLESGQYLDPVNDLMLLDVMKNEASLRDALQDECTINPMLSVLYFSIFMLVCAYIMIQLVIGIVLDNIQAASLMEDMAIGQDHVQAFVDAWEEVDPNGTSFIEVKQITTLLSLIPSPLGVRDLPQMHKRIQEIILDVDIPLRRGSCVHFMEVLHALAGRVAGAEIPVEEELRIYRHLMKSVPEGVPAYTAAHAYAAMAVSGAVRGFMQRVALKGIWDNPEVEHEVSFMKGEEGLEGRLVSIMHARGQSINAAAAEQHLQAFASRRHTDSTSAHKISFQTTNDGTVSNRPGAAVQLEIELNAEAKALRAKSRVQMKRLGGAVS